MRTRTHSGLGRRMIAAFVALSVAVATLSGVAHRAIVEHVACEHGQLVEVGSQATAPVVAHRDVAISAAADHEHHHCALQTFRADGTGIVTRPCSQPLAIERRAAVVFTTVHARATLPYAPKTSPPV